MRTAEEMRGLQRLPLDIKVAMTMDRIREWVDTYGEDGVCVSFSGGKDSTVLLHLVRSYAPNVKAVFSDTGLEYPEIRNFVKTFDNVDCIKPKMTFGEIVGLYGYPLFSKEISNTIWYARKLRGGGSVYHFRRTVTGHRLRQSEERDNGRGTDYARSFGTDELPPKKIIGNIMEEGTICKGICKTQTLFPRARGMGQVNFQQREILACLPRTSLFDLVELLRDNEKASDGTISTRNRTKTVYRHARGREYASVARLATDGL